MLRRKHIHNLYDDEDKEDEAITAKQMKVNEASPSSKKMTKHTHKSIDREHTGDLKIDRESYLEDEVLGVGEDILDTLVTKSQRKKKKKQKVEVEHVKKWHDSDDEDGKDFEVNNPSWAGTFVDEHSDDSDEEALKAHSQKILTDSISLPPTFLGYKRVTDGNKADPAKGSLSTVEFHPKATVLLAGGQDNTVRLFAVDGSKNSKIHSMFLDRTPVLCSHFNRDGSEIIIGSKHKSFYVYDMEGSKGVTFRPKLKGLEIAVMAKFNISPDGRFIAFLGIDGYIHLFSQKSKELIDSVKMNGYVKSVSFSKDGRSMYSFGNDGEVYIWDMNTRDCIHHFSDDGCINGTCVAVSPDNNYIACGSDSGIVNIYDLEAAKASRFPKPLKLIKNLTTPCSNALFNSESELLALRSKSSVAGVRLVHFPSLTVLQNFPDHLDLDLKSLTSMDFSPSSGYMALGNNKGRCLLYRLEHYSKY